MINNQTGVTSIRAAGRNLRGWTGGGVVGAVAVGALLVGSVPAAAAASSIPRSTSPVAKGAAAEVNAVPVRGDIRDPLARFYTQKVTWTPCGQGAECAKIRVPLSYSKPQGRTILIALARRITAGAKAPYLFFDPGGPGGSGTDFITSQSNFDVLLNPSSPPVRSAYNFLGFDPRGVNRSTRLTCLTQAQTTALAVGELPITRAQVRARAALSGSISQGCERRARTLTANIGTDTVARDLEVARIVLKQSRLNYYGVSYGTYIGAIYARLFPGRVGRMLLDAVVPPSGSVASFAREQAVGFQSALLDWAAGCPTRVLCPYKSGTADQAVSKVTALIAKLAANPLPVSGATSFGGSQFRGLTLTALSAGAAFWPVLDIWAWLAEAAIPQSGPALQKDYETFVATAQTPNAVSVLNAVNCFDRPSAGTTATTVARSAAWSTQSPTFGAALAWGVQPCFSWPFQTSRTPAGLRSATLRPVLLIGGLHDPNTPYQWAQQMTKQFRHGRLLTWTGFGHGATTRADPCVNNQAADYLVTGRLPGLGARC
ncbi:MAG: alpha/beta hydrolase [Actinomycetes bacterium]